MPQMLTMPMLITLWSLAAIFLFTMLWCLWKRRWVSAFISYFMVGLFGIALPFKIMLHVTTIFAMVFLSLIWPVWMGQHHLGYTLPPHLPRWLVELMFDF